MRSFYLAAVVLLAGALCAALPAKADDISTFIGTQNGNFTNGATVTSLAYKTADMSQPAPFNAACGSDGLSNCSATWTFNYIVPSGDTITGATLTLGIVDIDSAATGDQVGSFTLDGTDDLTALLNTSSEAAAGANNVYNILSIVIPGADFTDLGTGSATFALTLKGLGLGALGTSPFNGADLDFSRLDITATPGSTPPVPEPGTSALLMLGLAALATKATFSKQA
jgi:PEP-CTERM motif